eukprot:889034-Pyramimonas_sp.AAC.1
MPMPSLRTVNISASEECGCAPAFAVLGRGGKYMGIAVKSTRPFLHLAAKARPSKGAGMENTRLRWYFEKRLPHRSLQPAELFV